MNLMSTQTLVEDHVCQHTIDSRFPKERSPIFFIYVAFFPRPHINNSTSHAAMFAKQHNKNTPNWSCFCIHWGFCVLKHCRGTFDVMVNGRYKNYGHSYIPAASSFSIKEK